MFERYAIYYTAQGAFATHGAAWLGWDVDQGVAVSQPSVDGLDISAMTETPRRYGFHGTIKPPFRLAEGMNEAGLYSATKTLTQQVSSISMDGLEVTALGRFLALIPLGDATALRDMAAQVVQSLDRFRAPLTDEERTRRQMANLSPARERNLQMWGYPHVMDQFRFHMTLTNRLPKPEIAKVRATAARHFEPVLPNPFVVDALTLTGQRVDGMFQIIERFPLT